MCLGADVLMDTGIISIVTSLWTGGWMKLSGMRVSAERGYHELPLKADMRIYSLLRNNEEGLINDF